MMRNERARFGRGALGLTLCLLAACADATPFPDGAKPQGGTETGNPPLIDAQRIALVVSADSLRVVGSAGAITPGGAAIEVVALSTGRAFTTTAWADGSFDVAVAGPLAETFAVRATNASQSSSAVYVLRGGASVNAGEDGGLSCDARSQSSRTQMLGAASAADNSCTVDADCRAVSLDTDCFHGCSSGYVSEAGAAQLTEARAAIEGGLCAEFARDGCRAAIPPCTPPSGALRCVEKQCAYVEGEPAADCTSDFDLGDSFAATQVYWFNPTTRACEGRTYGGTGGNENRYASSAACIAACAPNSDPGCPPNHVWASACVTSGIAGGCGGYEMKCSLACSRQVDCVDEEPVQFCNEQQGFCEVLGI